MSQPLIIGLNGQARVGKDTAADYLCKKYGFAKISLADPIKRYVMDMFGLEPEHLWGDLKDQPNSRFPRICTHGCKDIKVCDVCKNLPEFFMPREFVQYLGTEYGRRFYPNIWLDKTFQTISKLDARNGWAEYSSVRGITERSSFKEVFPFGYIIPDIRFINEIQYLEDKNCILARILRPSISINSELMKHSSESEQLSVPDSRFKHMLLNDSTLDDYYIKVDNFFKSL